MSDWRSVEIYSAFLRVTGQLEIVRPDRVSDAVNRFGEYLHLRDARVEPLSLVHPVLGRGEPRATLTKAAAMLICPVGDVGDGNPALWREKVATAAVITSPAFSMIGDVHLDPRHSFEDHLQRYPGDFVAITNLSALWITSLAAETHTLQRPVGLLNPAAILSFSLR